MRSTILAGFALTVAFGQSVQAQQFDEFIVTFTDHASDLAPLHAAMLDGRSGAEVQAMIKDLEQHAQLERADFAREIEQLDGEITKHYWLINASFVRVPVGRREAIAGLDGVDRIWANETRAPASLHLVPVPIRIATNANNHNADALQAQGIDGAGVTVAIVDAGLDENMGTRARPHAVFYPNGDPNNRTGPGIGGSRMLANVQIGRLPADGSVSHGTRVAASAIGGRWNNTPVSDHGHAPGASVVGYSLSDLSGGVTELQTMVAAWQRVVIDSATYGITVANMSYAGTAQSQSPEQQAMDAAVQVADLLVTVSAGIRDPFYYHGAVNVLAVGAVTANTHTVPMWGTLGPLSDGRVYPQIVANGDGIYTPVIDNEAVNMQSYGTSHAAPQVAGAAALFRSVAVGASALETRAALLATTKDISDRTIFGQSGYGYLRDDRLVALAQGNGLLKSGSVSGLATRRSYSMTVAGGETYAVALAWNRQIPANSTWADLDLEVWQDGERLAASARTRDVNERVKFRARSSGTVELRVVLKNLEPQTPSQAFAIAGSVAPDAIVPGEWRAYGVGCSSNASVAPTGINTSPVGHNNAFAAAGENGVFSGSPHRFQIVPRQVIVGAVTAHAIAFRFDNSAAPVTGRQWVDLEIDIGQTPADILIVNTSFAANRSNTVVTVVRRRVIVLPPQPIPNTNPREWSVVIPFDQAISTYPDRGGLLVDVKVYGSSPGLNYPVDATSSMSRVLYANSPTATTGVVGGHRMPIVGIVERVVAGETPLLSATGIADVGKTFTLVISDAAANAPVLFVAGASASSWAGLMLPFDLAPLSAPRCFVLASLDVTMQRTANALGGSSLPLNIPNSPTLIGNTLYQQALCVDLLANRLGLTTSNGIAVTIGGR